MKIRHVGAEFFSCGRTDGQTDGQTDMTKLILAFFAILQTRLKRSCVVFVCDVYVSFAFFICFTDRAS